MIDNNIYVVGLLVEKYVDKSVSGHNCSFDYEDTVFDRYVLMLKKDWLKFEITLSNKEGECGSGWCCASWGEMELKRVAEFRPFNYAPKETLILKGADILYEENGYEVVGKPVKEDDDYYDDDVIKTNVFVYDECGYDPYYPSGGVSVNMDLFKPLKRGFEKRPVWIFAGGSGLGKSTIAMYALREGAEVYETDSADELPEVITADIIVLGNRSKFTLDDVKAKVFGDAEIVIVNFEKEKKE